LDNLDTQMLTPHLPELNPIMKIPAVVVGACSHSLSITRSLSREGVEAHVLEANLSLPGLQSRYVQPHLVGDINGEGLIKSLVSLRQRVSPDERPVLFLSNDRMVKVVAAHLEEVTRHYRLSWAKSARCVTNLLDKTSIAPQCARAGLSYPKTVCIARLEDIGQAAADFQWPCIVKPVWPLSGFKAELLETPLDAMDFLSRHANDLPVLLQDWIPGGEGHIYFSAGYYEQGTARVTFGGRKLRSFPMGHTTVAEPCRDEEVERCAASFFADTRISGPASLELKRDSKGQLWVIEPTVGRTDFWLDLCVQNGVNLPFIHYLHQTGQPLPKTSQQSRAIWINSERDTRALPWYFTHLNLARHRLLSLRLSYLAPDDMAPFWVSLRNYTKALPGRLRQLLSNTKAR